MAGHTATIDDALSVVLSLFSPATACCALLPSESADVYKKGC